MRMLIFHGMSSVFLLRELLDPHLGFICPLPVQTGHSLHFFSAKESFENVRSNVARSSGNKNMFIRTFMICDLRAGVDVRDFLGIPDRKVNIYHETQTNIILPCQNLVEVCLI